MSDLIDKIHKILNDEKIHSLTISLKIDLSGNTARLFEICSLITGEHNVVNVAFKKGLLQMGEELKGVLCPKNTGGTNI